MDSEPGNNPTLPSDIVRRALESLDRVVADGIRIDMDVWVFHDGVWSHPKDRFAQVASKRTAGRGCECFVCLAGAYALDTGRNCIGAIETSLDRLRTLNTTWFRELQYPLDGRTVDLPGKFDSLFEDFTPFDGEQSDEDLARLRVLLTKTIDILEEHGC